MGDRRDVSLCIDCGECVNKCPQQLDIPVLLNEVDGEFHGKWVRPIIPIAKRILKRVL